MTRLHFIHIPKTAGCSVRAWLRHAFGDGAICPARDWDEMLRLGRQNMPHYRVFAGHYGQDLAGFLGVEFISAAVLRDPVDRTFSHYRHVFRDTGHPRHAYVSRQSFEAFVLDTANWPMIENFQARYFVATPVSFQAIARGFDVRPEKARFLSVLSEDARYLYDEAYVREQSIAAMAKLDVVGTTESLATFLQALAARVPAYANNRQADPPRENVAPQDAGVRLHLSDRGYEAIRKLTTIDHELHAIASAKACAQAGPAASAPG